MAYQAKQNKNPVILLSSSYSNPSVDSGEAKKLQMILDYNASKDGVDTFDQNLEKLFCREKLSARRCCKQRIHINTEEWSQKFSERLPEKADIGVGHTLHTILTV